MNKEEFKAKLKEEFNIEVKTRSRSNSTFSIVKSKMREDNESKGEVIYKILSEMKEKNIEVNDDSYKKVTKLLANLLTYVRKSYPGYESQNLIETNEKFMIVEI